MYHQSGYFFIHIAEKALIRNNYANDVHNHNLCLWSEF